MISVINWVKRYGLRNTILRGIYSVSPFLPCRYDRQLRKNIWYSFYKEKLKKYIIYPDKYEMREEKNENRVIWWCWLQGLEQAPDIVKKCYQSVEYYSAKMNYKLICLNQDNIFNYIDIPESIIIKWRNGLIGSAHFTDLCRLFLLADLGGIWIDATILLSGMIDEDILDADFFVFQESPFSSSVIKVSNWFMAAKRPGNMFVVALRDSLVNYWLHNKKAGDYFIMHLLFHAMVEQSEFKSLYDNIPFLCNSYPKLMERRLCDDFDEIFLRHVLKLSSIHKLTYKGSGNWNKNSLGFFLLHNDINTIYISDSSDK